MAHVGCVFVAGIQPSRTQMSGSFGSMRWNTCVHGLDFRLCSHPKEFWGNEVRTYANSKGKIPSTRKILLWGGMNPWHCIKQDSKPNTLPTELFWPDINIQIICKMMCTVLMLREYKYTEYKQPSPKSAKTMPCTQHIKVYSSWMLVL